jgi:hypothetical protein
VKNERALHLARKTRLHVAIGDLNFRGGDNPYFLHGQGCDNMMQDSPAAHNHYLRTLVF